MLNTFLDRGWVRFPVDEALRAWLDGAEPVARATLTDPAHAEWHRCGGTWFAGVNALPNDAQGALPGGGPLAGQAVEAALDHAGAPVRWDQAQVSVCYPGYPKPRDGESEASFRFRKNRDAAHVDGLLPVGPQRRRFLREHHQFILGIPIGPADDQASPLVVWEGSHDIMRRAFATFFGDAPPEAWGDLDITDAYHAARRKVFEECRRVVVTAGWGKPIWSIAWRCTVLRRRVTTRQSRNAWSSTSGQTPVILPPGLGRPSAPWIFINNFLYLSWHRSTANTLTWKRRFSEMSGS